MVRNVPLNNLLAAAAPGTPQAAELWTRYLREWTRWNTVRTVASALSAILFMLALLSSLLGARHSVARLLRGSGSP